MQNALIYSAGFEGHRQVYIYVLSHVLSENGYNIFIAGNTQEKIINASYIEKIKKETNVVFIDTSDYAENGLKILPLELINIQRKYKIDLTVFAEADHHISLFTAQIGNKINKLTGKNIGIFLRPFYFYSKLNFIDKLRFVKRLTGNWRFNDRLFHGFTLQHFKLLDKACYIDENFVSHHKHAVWLPDVFQQYAEELLKDENLDESIWINKLDDFRENNSGKFIFLYFGTAQPRRGYDTLLKLAVDSDACFVHCGLNNDKENFDFNIEELKTVLRNDGRLFETNQYITDPACIEYFFKSVSHLVLPYRKFLGSSGVMLQALEYGIPVLVPNTGIIGYRVRMHKLGLTFDNNYKSLVEQFKRFILIPKQNYHNSINEYMQYQSISQLKKVLTGVINDTNLTIKLP